MKEVNFEFGNHNFNARVVASRTTPEAFVDACRKNPHRNAKTPTELKDDSYEDLTDEQLKEIHAKCVAAVNEADGIVKPAPKKS